MKYTFVGKNTVVSEALKEKTVDKLEKLSKIVPEGTDVTITFSVVKNTYKAEVSLPFNKRTLRSESATGDMYASVDEVVAKLEKQVKKYKSRLQDRSGKNNLYKEEFNNLAQFEADEEVDDKVIKTKKYVLKPMTVDEAILEMELVGHDFFVFKDADRDELRIVYTRIDGTYGIIEEDL